MSLEVQLRTVLITALPSGQVYRGVANPGITPPWIVFQQVGGRAQQYVERALLGKKHARMQVATWHSRYDDAFALAHDVEDAMTLTSTFPAVEVMGAPIYQFDPSTKLHGAIQDFAIWFDD